MKLEGQAAIVTGGGQGIGRAVVERLAAEGARVAVLDMNPDNAKEVIEGLDTPANHLALQTNVADSASVIASIRQARETFGRLDMAVNNAGIGQAPGDGSDKFYEAMGKRTEEITSGQEPTTHVDHLIHMGDDGWAGVLGVNLNGTFYVCREVVRLLQDLLRRP